MSHRLRVDAAVAAAAVAQTTVEFLATLPTVGDWDEVAVYRWLLGIGWDVAVAEQWREEFVYGSILLGIVGLVPEAEVDGLPPSPALEQLEPSLRHDDVALLRASLCVASMTKAEVCCVATMIVVLPSYALWWWCCCRMPCGSGVAAASTLWGDTRGDGRFASGATRQRHCPGRTGRCC